MDSNVREAIRILGINTAGRFDVWMLAGGPKASCRAHVMSTLAGKRMPQSKSGVTAIRSAFYEALAITGECEAHREEQFRAICRELAQGQFGVDRKS